MPYPCRELPGYVCAHGDSGLWILTILIRIIGCDCYLITGWWPWWLVIFSDPVPRRDGNLQCSWTRGVRPALGERCANVEDVGAMFTRRRVKIPLFWEAGHSWREHNGCQTINTASTTAALIFYQLYTCTSDIFVAWTSPHCSDIKISCWHKMTFIFRVKMENFNHHQHRCINYCIKTIFWRHERELPTAWTICH